MSTEKLEEDDGVLVEPPQVSSSPAPPTSAGDASGKSASAAAVSALAKKVDEAESATDTPAPKKDGKLDALSVKLPHLPSPFDASYPRTRGGGNWKSIVEDGHCMVCEVQKGDGKGNVPVLNRVYINVEGKLENGTTFLDFGVEELDFTLGQAQVPKGLEMAVCQMSAGQHNLIRCYPDYGYSTTRRPPNVPADATLFMNVTVLRWEKEKNLHEMNLEDKWAYCEKRRQLGKDAFLTGKKPRTACKQYEKALTVLDSILNHENSPSVIEKKNDLLVLFWTNQAQCWMKIPDGYARAIELCNKTLVLRPRHPKALFRRAEARKQREEWDEAMKDYQALLELHAEQLSGKETKHEKLDPLVIAACEKSLKLISSKRSTQAQAQRKRMDGFLRKGGESAALYEDMPAEATAVPDEAVAEAVSSSSSSSAAKKPTASASDDDFSWLSQHSAGQPSLWKRLLDTAVKGVEFVRSFCGQKKAVSKKAATGADDSVSAEEAKKTE